MNKPLHLRKNTYNLNKYTGNVYNMGVGEAFSLIVFCVLVERKSNVSITLKILYLMKLHDNS